MNINDILKHINLSALKDNIKSAVLALINLIEELSSEKRRLKDEIQQLRDENNRLKGEQGKPDIKASRPEDARQRFIRHPVDHVPEQGENRGFRLVAKDRL